MKKAFTLFAAVCCLIFYQNSMAENVTHTFTDSGWNRNFMFPIDMQHKYSLSQQIFSPQEAGVYGEIYSITLYHSTIPEDYTITRTINIAIGQTDKSIFQSSSQWIDANLQYVFSGKVVFSSDKTTITFDKPCTYYGTSNLVLSIEDRTGSTEENYLGFDYYKGENNYHKTLRGYSNKGAIASNQSNAEGMFLDDYRCKITFEGSKNFVKEYSLRKMPINTEEKYSCSEQIYTPEEVGIGTIDKIILKNCTYGFARRNLEIYMGVTDKENFTGDPRLATTWIPTSDLWKVFEGEVRFEDGKDVTIPLTTRFESTGKRNYVVYVCDKSGYSSSPAPDDIVRFLCRISSSTLYRSIYAYSSSDPVTAKAPGDYAEIGFFKNNIDFGLFTEPMTSSSGLALGDLYYFENTSVEDSYIEKELQYYNMGEMPNNYNNSSYLLPFGIKLINNTNGRIPAHSTIDIEGKLNGKSFAFNEVDISHNIDKKDSLIVKVSIPTYAYDLLDGYCVNTLEMKVTKLTVNDSVYDLDLAPVSAGFSATLPDKIYDFDIDSLLTSGTGEPYNMDGYTMIKDPWETDYFGLCPIINVKFHNLQYAMWINENVTFEVNINGDTCSIVKSPVNVTPHDSIGYFYIGIPVPNPDNLKATGNTLTLTPKSVSNFHEGTNEISGKGITVSFNYENNTALENNTKQNTVRKAIIDGQVVIIRNEEKYNVLGQSLE